MRYAVAYKRTRKARAGIKTNWYAQPFWFVLLDRNGKVRDWIEAANAKSAMQSFQTWRMKPIPKGYTVEKRGPVTKENW